MGQSGIPGYDADSGRLAADLTLMDNVQFQQLAESGSVSALVTLPAVQGIYPQLNRNFSHQDRLWLQPLVLSPLVLCYNKAHFREKGLMEPDGSWNWNDLIRHAEQLSDGRGRYGFAFHVQSSYRWPLFLLQSGEPFVRDENGNIRDIRGTALLENLRLCKRILHNRQAFPLYLSESDEDINRMFMDGQLSMTLNTYMGLNSWNPSMVDYDISPVPYTDHLRTLCITLGVGISSSTPHEQEARLFTDYLASPQAQELIRRHTLSVPALGSLPKSGEPRTLFAPDRFGLYRETMGSLCTHADTNLSIAEYRSLADILKRYWADMIDEDELCERFLKALSIRATGG